MNGCGEGAVWPRLQLETSERGAALSHLVGWSLCLPRCAIRSWKAGATSWSKALTERETRQTPGQASVREQEQRTTVSGCGLGARCER